MAEPELLTSLLPRLLAELNTTSVVLLLSVLVLWLQLRAVSNRYIAHLEEEIKELGRDRWFGGGGSSAALGERVPKSPLAPLPVLVSLFSLN